MADLRVKTGTSSVEIAGADGEPVDARATRDGALFSAPWFTALALEGRCFGANAGTGTSPVSFVGSWVATTPDLFVSVPTGTTIIPVYIEICQETVSTYVTGAVIDCLAVISAVEDTSSGGTALTISNMRMDDPRTSNCTATRTCSTVSTPYTGNYLEFWRGNAGVMNDSYTGATAWTSELIAKTYWSGKDCVAPPVIVGPGSLAVYNAQVKNTDASTGTGWMTVIWAEIPSISIV